MQEYKDLTFNTWDTGSPEFGEHVLRVSLMFRANNDDEWEYQTFKLCFDDVDERNACIKHYSDLYGT